MIIRKIVLLLCLAYSCMVVNAQTSSSSNQQSEDEKAFFKAVKAVYQLQEPVASICSNRFLEYAGGLDYEPITQSQDPGPAVASISKVSANTYRVSWTTMFNGKKQTLQQLLFVVNENGSLKIDNIKVEKHPYTDMVDGKLLFDYSKPASFYNVFEE